MRQIVLFLLLPLCLAISAQELSVKEFREATNDLSARTRSRQDNNGNDCALVKVQLAASGATFTGNVMGNVAFSNNEYWVYLTEGTKRLKVLHPSYLPLEVSFADYGISQLKERSTYVLSVMLEEQPQECQIIVDRHKSSIKVTGKMTYKDWGKLKRLMDETIRQVDLRDAESNMIPDGFFKVIEETEEATEAPFEEVPEGVEEVELLSILLPSGITTIGDRAFDGCQNLTSITIPNSVTTIGSWAFDGCQNLTSITIPNSVTEIGFGAFRDCSGLTSINIPNSVRYIGGEAFRDCSGLTSVTIPNSVTEIRSGVFDGCHNLTSITIPISVKSIGSGAFYDCYNLTSVTIPNSVKTIGDYAFCGCENLSSITIPNSITIIGEGAFCGCENLSSITIPNSVTTIGEGAFAECKSLILTIPNSVKRIGDSAVYGCKKFYLPQRFQNRIDRERISSEPVIKEAASPY